RGICCHGTVSGLEVGFDDVVTNEVFDELTDVASPDDGVQAVVDFFVEGDGELFMHTYKIRIMDFGCMWRHDLPGWNTLRQGKRRARDEFGDFGGVVGGRGTGG